MLFSRPTAPADDGRTSEAGPECKDELNISVPATNAGAQWAIGRIKALVEDEDGPRREDVEHFEIAMAEVLNNIVEHAYEDSGEGTIELSVQIRDPGLHITLWDDGTPMPAGRLPGGAPADPGLDPHEQAEGGYGLFMIRQLARKLRYERIGDRNRLSFRIKLAP